MDDDGPKSNLTERCDCGSVCPCGNTDGSVDSLTQAQSDDNVSELRSRSKILSVTNVSVIKRSSQFS